MLTISKESINLDPDLTLYLFHKACQDGDLDLLKQLEEIAPDKILAMIQANYYWAYRYACKNGHLAILMCLEKMAPEHVHAMICAHNCWSFRYAAEYGHLNVLKHLVKRAPDEVQRIIREGNYWVFHKVALNGDLVVLKYLEIIVPNEVLPMIQAHNYWVYRNAAKNGHLDILKHFEEMAPDEVLAMIQADNYAAYRYAAQNGHLKILKHLEEIAPNDKQAMIQANNYSALRSAAADHRENVVNHMLTFPQCFAYAESHEIEYGEKYIYPFVEEKTNALRAQRQAFEQENQSVEFDAAEQDRDLYFYILNHLIRRNDKRFLPQINELLLLPSLRDLLRQSVNEGPSNKMEALAIRIGNQDAANILLKIPKAKASGEDKNSHEDEANRYASLEKSVVKRSLHGFWSPVQKRGIDEETLSHLKKSLSCHW